MFKKIVYFILLGVVVAGCHGDYMDLGDNYSLVNRCLCHTNDRGIDVELIIGDIVKLDLNDSYIIAYQEVNPYYIKHDHFYSKGEERIHKYMSTHPHNYWIIDKKTVKVYGPLTKEAFDKSCDSLNINLTLKSIFMK
jgi:hypothetical protein